MDDELKGSLPSQPVSVTKKLFQSSITLKVVFSAQENQCHINVMYMSVLSKIVEL